MIAKLQLPGVSIHLNGSKPALRIPANAATLDGFREWTQSPDFPEHGKIEFIDGEIFIDMSPERLNSHNLVKGAMGFTLELLRRKEKLGRLFVDGALVVNQEANVCNEPDLVFVSRENIQQKKVTFSRTKLGDDFWEIEGAPDVVVEIVSPSSVEKDHEILRKKYFKGKIPEYWLVDSLGDEVDFQILVAGRKKYEPAATALGFHFSPTFRKWFRLVGQESDDSLMDYELEYCDERPKKS